MLTFNNYLNPNCWKTEDDKLISFNNGEVTITCVTRAYLTCINLSKYQSFNIIFELFNPTNNRFHVGTLDTKKGLILFQDTANSRVLKMKDGKYSGVKNFSYNFFSTTNIWHNIQIKKKGPKGTFRFDERTFDFNGEDKGDFLYFRKWNNGNFQIKNIKISMSQGTIYNNPEQKRLFIIFFISFILIK